MRYNLSENYLLDGISSPDDVKKLPQNSLEELAVEIRRTIIEVTSKNGGHLASNLGMVEPSIVLHRVFDCENGDRFIFDVGHQAYAHKILTGRYKAFTTLRTLGGISGLTNKSESEYDTVTTGHSGTSLSTAVGLAEANRLSGKNSWVVAIIGDGSFTNGMIYEALNQVACRRLKLIIILNDNEMSISKNVGGLSEYLSYIRTSDRYFNLKTAIKNILLKVPFVGENMISAARRAKDFVKRITNSETWFESFGLEYIGPVDGNDMERLTSVLEEAKQKNAPVVVHMKTKKGKGYAPAERYPERFHSTSGFELDDSANFVTAVNTVRTYTDAFSDIICKKAAEDKGICAVTAAMAQGCGLEVFRDSYPDRFFDVGIAEEHAVTMAAGMALGGLKPVTVIYSTFAQRVYDQLWHDVVLQHIPLTLVISHTGIVPGDGVTHQGVFDYALFSTLPGVKIFEPYDERELEKRLSLSVSAERDDGLHIIRYPKDKVHPELCAEYIPSVDCDSLSVWEGDDVRLTVVTSGREVCRVLEIVKENEIRDVRVVALKRIYPLPDELYSHLGDRNLVIEENSLVGGIGEKLASEMKKRNITSELKIIAVENTEIPHGKLDELYRYAGFDSESILNIIKK